MNYFKFNDLVKITAKGFFKNQLGTVIDVIGTEEGDGTYLVEFQLGRGRTKWFSGSQLELARKTDLTGEFYE